MSPESQLFEAEDLLLFLTVVDEHLTEPANIIILGGSAIALYGVRAGTTDIDTFETDLARLKPAMDRAREQTGLEIRVSDPGVADVPYHYRDRLHRVAGSWTRLQVHLLERHDLVLSKTLRGNENDLAAIEKLHRHRPLDRDTLLARYLGEMGHAIGNRPDRLDPNFVLMILRLFDEIAAEEVQETLILHRRSEAKP